MLNDEVLEIESFEYDDYKKVKGSIRWDISDMMKLRFKQKANLNPSFYRVFNPAYNMTRPFKKEIRYRTTGERNITIEITGYTGSGKSLVGMTMAVEWMNKPMTIKDICFTTDALLSRAMEIGKNHTLIQDEQINQLGAGSVREEYERQTLEDTTRKFGLNIIFCSPVTKDHTTAHYNLEIICMNKKKRLTKVAIIGTKGNYLGYFVINVLPESNRLWKQYNKEKDKFIKGILSRSTKRLSLDDMSNSLTKHKLWKYAGTRELKKIIALKLFPTMTINELSMIVDNQKLMEMDK